MANRFAFGIQDSSQVQIPSIRYQQVYAASEFASFGAGGEFISEIRFRPDGDGATAFSSTLPAIQIDLSTTTAAPDGLSATLADNVGLDDAVAFIRRPLSLSSEFTGPTGGSKAFDIVVSLTSPFFYNPALGNLLLDDRNFGGGEFTTYFDAQDLVDDAVYRQYANQGPNSGGVNQPTASTGFPISGLVTQFMTVVPEPSLFSGLMVESVLFLTRRRLVYRTIDWTSVGPGATNSKRGRKSSCGIHQRKATRANKTTSVCADSGALGLYVIF